MHLKRFFLFFFSLLNLIVIGQDLELIHNISSDRTYHIEVDGGRSMLIYLNFYSPGVVDYKAPKFFLVTGWYEVRKDNKKNNLVGIYRPSNNLVLYVPKDKNQKYIDCINDVSLNIDTTSYLERFNFPLNEKSNNTKNAIWFDGNKKIHIENIDVDKKNVYHKIYFKGGGLNRSIDITDFVISPFGNNDVFLEDYNIKIYSTFTDSLGNLHVLLYISSEYVIPSSLSSGGYYYLLLDKNQIIRDNTYFETYNQGNYIAYIDDDFIHPSKQRFLIFSDWSDNQIIGSFYIQKSRIKIEKEWKNYKQSF